MPPRQAPGPATATLLPQPVPPAIQRHQGKPPSPAHVVLALEHQRPSRTHPDAVAAVHASGIRQWRIELGRDVRIEPPPRDTDGKRVLRINSTGLDALVAKDAPRVIPHIELVVHLDRLRHRRRPNPEPLGHRAVPLHPPPHLRRTERHVNRGTQQLQHEPPAVPNPLRIRPDLHPRLDPARTGRHKDPRPLHLHDTYTTNIDRGQVVELTQGRRVDLEPPASIEDRRPLEHLDLAPIDAQRHKPLRQPDENSLSHSAPSAASTPKRWHWPRSGRDRRSKRPASPARCRSAA